jgi:hypothetical protein
MPINTANKSSAVPITIYGSLIFQERSRADRDTSPFTLVNLSQPERLRHRFRNNVMGGLSPRSSGLRNSPGLPGLCCLQKCAKKAN